MMRVIIIGGGASGLMAAITAARNGAKVTVLEHQNQVGKKILVTGNGRCNFTNTNQDLSHYHSESLFHMAVALKQFTCQDTVKFFKDLGIFSKNRNGYLYPHSDAASAILDVLRMECEHLKVKIACQIEVESIEKCDPERQYLLEFALGDRTDRYVDYLTSIDIVPNIANKKTGRVVYYRHSEKIKEFTARASMNRSIFAIMNEQISSDLDNYVQRVSNCTAGNISKTVDAAMKYNNVIARLDKAKLLSSLPEELAATAILRMEYPDLTLAELARISVPPISKSGLAHRLNKILEFSEKLLGNDE